MKAIYIFCILLLVACKAQHNPSVYITQMKELSIAFNPDTTNNTPYNFSKKEVKIIREASEHNPDSARYFLSLMLLKIYRSHLICCNQSYSIANETSSIDSIENPLFYYFKKTTNYTENKELTTTSFILKWVVEQNDLLGWEPIKKEIAYISHRKKRIENGDFW